MDPSHIHSAAFTPVSKVLLTCVCVSGQRGDCPLFHLYVETASQAGRHRGARRGGGVRVSTGEQQKLHVLRAAVAKGRTSKGVNQSYLGHPRGKKKLSVSSWTLRKKSQNKLTGKKSTFCDGNKQV